MRDTWTSHFGPKKITGLAGGSGKFKTWPRVGLAYIFMALEPSRGPIMGQGPRKWSQINQGQLGSHLAPISGVLDPFRGLERAPKPKARPILGNIWTLPDRPCQPGQIFLVQNGLYRCPTYSNTCFMLNSYLWGYFWPSEVRFRGILALSRDWFYNGQKNKMQISQNPLMGGFWSLGI